MDKTSNQESFHSHVGLGCRCFGGTDPCCDREVEDWDVRYGKLW